MGAEKRRRFQPDPRTWLLLCLLGIAAILVIRSEIGCLCLFLACLLIHMLAGNGGKILPYGLYYLIFYGIGWLGVHLMDSGVAFSVSSMLSSIGIVSRKVLVKNCICQRLRGLGRQLYCASFRQSPGNTGPSVLPSGSVGSG